MIRNIYILLLLAFSYSETLIVPSEYSNSNDTIKFIFPLRATDSFEGYNFFTTNDFVDHDSSLNQILDYNCGNRTFNVPNDENSDHAGTDYYLAPFPWIMMENESVEIVAAAEGMILVRQDGKFDHNCGGNSEDGPDWNGVVIMHSDSSILYYLHMKDGSVTNKNVGDSVSQGEYLGLPGSSGFSHIPHLHFEYHKQWPAIAEGVIDPYFGECDSSSYWVNQKPYYDSAILQVMTHSSPPETQECPGTTITHEQNIFIPGEEVYIGAYYRDHIFKQESLYRVYHQNGVIDINWIDKFHGHDDYSIGPDYPDCNDCPYEHSNQQGDITYWVESWRMHSIIIPLDISSMGDWKIEIDFEGEIYEHSFNVGYTDQLLISEINISESSGDYDEVINPGENIEIIFNINNFSLLNVVDLTGAIDCDNDDIIINNNIYYNSILSGESITNSDQPFSLSISENIEFGEYDCNINLIYYNELDEEYSIDLLLTLAISMNQFGFPVSSASEIKTSPLVIDIDNDGVNEIIFGDKNGFIRIINSDGTEIVDETFPYYTGNQIWGSAASADMDGDGLTEFVITSKSKHIYIFDKNGLKTDYFAGQYLMGTPAIGNLDDDSDLEVVIGGYSVPASEQKIFVINTDGSDVPGFPLILGEKMKAGVALSDFNNNGKDDIVVGTDNNNIYLIYDDGTIAPGFPYLTGDKVQVEPAIAEIEGEKIIFSGSNDNRFYAINSNGSLHFSLQTGDKVQTSPSILEYNGETYIFFGSNDEMIYAVDVTGNALSGWPKEVNGSIVGSVVFSDLDGDGEAEVVAATDIGDILCYSISGILYPHFPMNFNYAFTSSITINDIDMDGDLEILAGNSNSLVVIDVKESTNSDNSNYWYTFRGNNRRTGYFTLESDQLLGDINGDGILNVLDLVMIANMVLADDFNTIADMNEDGTLNVLDLVILVNIILGN